MNTTHVRALQRLSCAALTLAFATGCPGTTRVSTPDRVRTNIERWLTCEECNTGERDSVVALGSAAVPALIAALEGPADSSYAEFAQSIGENFVRARRQFDRLTPAERSRRPLGDSAALVRFAVLNFEAAWQTRAADVLYAIDAARSRTAFRARLQNDTLPGHRPLQPNIRALLDSLARP